MPPRRSRILSSASTAISVAPTPADLGVLTYKALLHAVRQIFDNDPKLDGATIQLGEQVRGLAELRQDSRYLAALRLGHLHDEGGVIRIARAALD